MRWLPNPRSTGHLRSGYVRSSISARAIVTSEGTTSRNSRPDAAVASQTTMMMTTMTMRSRVTGLSHGAGGRGRAGQMPGLSHFSIRSVPMKNNTLTRITKQIAA